MQKDFAGCAWRQGSCRLDVGAVRAGIRFGRGEGGQVEAQSLDGRFERAEPSGTTVYLVEKVVSLYAEIGVAVCRRRFVPRPITFADEADAPTPAVKLDLYASGGGVELKRGFVGCLKLVKGVADQNVAVAGD